MSLFKKAMVCLSPFALASAALAEGGYTVPDGVTTAIKDAEDAATALANAAIPGVAKIALAFVGLVIVWLIIKAIRRGAK